MSVLLDTTVSHLGDVLAANHCMVLKKPNVIQNQTFTSNTKIMTTKIYFSLKFVSVSYTHLTLPTNREV